MSPDRGSHSLQAREGHVTVAGAALYCRDIGRGAPILVIHGGPDFDHRYLLPDLDRLADTFRLVYYDQRGRGSSSGAAEDVSLESELQDLDAVRRALALGSPTILGHSWGGVLAMEYAIRHPERVSRLILMNTGPASHEDYEAFRRERRRLAAADVDRLVALSATSAYRAGDLEADAAYYRIHFGSTLPDPERLERLVRSLRAGFTPEGILRARALEERLMNATWWLPGYDLLPRLARLRVPTLVVHGERDLIPVECATRIAGAIPGARFVLLRGAGHFFQLEALDDVRSELVRFLA